MPGLGAMTRGLGNRVLAETNGAGVSLREYIWLDDQVIAVIDNANAVTPTPYWVTNDHLGRPAQMTNAARAVVWRAKYRPFGELVAVTGSAALDARFPGQWFHLEAGLSYNWHRHYDPSLGRYTQPDPLGWYAGPSLYGYVDQSPQMGSDPEGLQIAIPGPWCLAGPYAAAACAVPPLLACIAWLSRPPEPSPPAMTPYPAPQSPPFVAPPIMTPMADKPYAGQTPDDVPMIPIRGTPALKSPEDQSFWERDRTGHGGSKWKRWPDPKSWEKDRNRESVRPDGSVR